MKVLALDLSLNCPGFALLECDKKSVKLIEKSTVNNIKDAEKPAAKRKSTRTKLQEIANMLFYYLTTYQPDFVVRERGFSRHNLATQLLFRVVGICDLLVHQVCDKDVIELAPLTVKKMITGNGKADKYDVAVCLEKYIGYQIYETPDESDAVAVGISYLIQQELVNMIEVPDITKKPRKPRKKTDKKRVGRPRKKPEKERMRECARPAIRYAYKSVHVNRERTHTPKRALGRRL